MKKFRCSLWFVLIAGVSLLAFPGISFSSFFDTATSNGNTLTAWTEKEDILQTVIKVLKEDSSELYEYFSEEITGNFSKEDFTSALQDASAEIEGIEIISKLVVVDGGWSEAKIRIFLKDGSTQDFLLVFHKENGNLRIFGTENL